MPRPRRPIRLASRRGFTLLEALTAAGILLVIVVAVTSAITAGQQHAFEAHARIAATLAAEELLGRLENEPYVTLSSWHNQIEPVGSLLDMEGDALPDSYAMIGRRVDVSLETRRVGALDVWVRGRRVRVETFNEDDRVLAELVRFIPEPPS